MTLTIEAPKPSLLSLAEQLYTDSFPPEERRPWDDIANGNGPELHMVFADGKFAGFVTTWDLGSWTYIEHFAIMPDRRGGGIGAMALSVLKEMNCRPLLLEAEPPCEENPMAARRIEFYRRNGFFLLDYDYIQPPYAPGLTSVPLRLMCTEAATDATAAETALHTRVYKAI